MPTFSSTGLLVDTNIANAVQFSGYQPNPWNLKVLMASGANNFLGFTATSSGMCYLTAKTMAHRFYGADGVSTDQWGYVTTTGFVNGSARASKEDIQDYDPVAANTAFDAITLHRYRWKSAPDVLHLGVIADELLVDPVLATVATKDDEGVANGYAVGDLLMLAIAKIKSLAAEVAALKAAAPAPA